MMKTYKRFLALLLCAALLLSMAACTKTPAENTTPTVAETPEQAAYREARAAVDAAGSLTLKISAVKTTTVGGETFTEETEQTLHMTGLGTDNIMASSSENVTYSSDYNVTYDEVFTGGTLYVTLDGDYSFSGTMTAQEFTARSCPAILLDAALYSSITQEGNVLSFTAPTAAETWAMPEGAEFIEASGSATISDSGELQKTAYSITYTYGPAEVTLEAEAYVTLESVTVEAPEDTDKYIPLTHVDAARLSEMTLGYLSSSEVYNLSTLESVMSQAGAVIRNQSTVVNSYGSGADLKAKVEIGVYVMDYSTGESQELDQEELFLDGVYTVSTDGGEPQEYPSVNASTVSGYCENQKYTYMVDLGYWQDAAITDLGSVYLIELTFTEEMGSDMQDNICANLFGNKDIINDLASDYVTNEMSGYLAVDKYTGLPTATGYYYEGCHTIMGQECLLSLQADQSIEAPCLGAYYTITEEMLPEEEPENKATPLFYHVTGPDGQEMWLLGTIHVGDERTAYLPQEIYDALSASDALALEFYSKEFEEQVDEDEALSDAISDAYYYSDGSTIADVIGQELYDQAKLYMKASGNYNMNADYMKPYLWSQSINNFYLRQGFALTGDQGVESRLEKLAEDQGIEIRSIESGLFQIQMITGYSDELQTLLLEEAIEDDARVSWTGTMDLYEMWCAGDEAALREELSDEVDTSELTEEELKEYEEQLPLIEEYNQAMSYDRNDGMLEVAIGYLESGETVFYAVGLAHLLNNVNGLVDTLREAGYTVELVEFAE